MRGAVFVAVVVWAWAAASFPAQAAQRRARTQTPLRVGVLPFEGRGAGGADAKDALELELELVESAAVVSTSALEKDLARRGPDDAFQPTILAPLMKKRGVDVLVRGARAPGARTREALIVVAYAADGEPHFMKELALGGEADGVAAAVAGPLGTALATWNAQRVVRLPSQDGGRISVSDVIADDDEDPQPARARKPSPEAPAEPAEGRRRSRLDDPEPADPDAGDRGAGIPHSARRSRLDDEPADTEGARTRSRLDDEVPGSRLDDEEPATDAAPPARPGHTLAVAALFRGATWQYRYSGVIEAPAGPSPVEAVVNVPFFPGGALRIDFWPLEWLGVEAEGAAGAIRLVLRSPSPDATSAFAPDEFTAYQLSGAAVAKARYVLSSGVPGLGIGARVGYRYWGGTTETQILQPPGAQVTIVPGFGLHALSTGLGVDVPFRVAERRVEIELRADLLALNRYEEAPDNPGRSSLAIGWSGSLTGRFEIVAGLFGEVGVHTIGAGVSYEGAPKAPRQLLVNGAELFPLAGGTVMNLDAGFDVGVGYMF